MRAIGIFAVLAWLSGCAGAGPDTADLLVRNGRLVDGTGAPGRSGDLAVRGGRIVAIGDLAGWTAPRVLDAAGLVVAPGFVDVHGHADLVLLAEPAVRRELLSAKIRQGVTTLIVGNCGLGTAPSEESAAAVLTGINAWMTPAGVSAGPASIETYLTRLESNGVPLNVGTLVPHGPVRISAMGLVPGAPSPAAIDTMRAAVARGLDEGAFGLSTGLIYPPGMFAPTDELVALAEVVAGRGALFTSHVRGSSETLVRATEELIEIARRSGARVHHSHLEAVGEPFWPRIDEVLALEDAARAEGLAISHDVFPYTRAATMMSAIFPPWTLEGGMPGLVERLRDRDTRRRIRNEIETRAPRWPPWREGGWPHNLVGAVGWDGVRVASVGAGGPSELSGRSLADLAEEAGRDPFEVVADLMVASGGRVGQLVDEISGREDRIDALVRILAHPASIVISDAEDYGKGVPHPAHAGAFARALRLSRERGLLPLETIVAKMTARPASLLGIDDRGVIAEGSFADLVVFDPGRVADRATWEEPRLPALGIRWVVLNGVVVVEDGHHGGVDAGRVLRRRHHP